MYIEYVYIVEYVYVYLEYVYITRVYYKIQIKFKIFQCHVVGCIYIGAYSIYNTIYCIYIIVYTKRHF